MFGIVKLIASLCCAFFLVDVLGRRRSVTIGLALQTIAALYLTIFVSQVNPDTEAANAFKSAAEEHASRGAIFIIFVAGIGWALGVNTIQYLIGT